MKSRLQPAFLQPHLYASMYHDLARGRRMELESLSGYVVRKGGELGVPTPVHAPAYAYLKPFINGAAKLLVPRLGQHGRAGA